VLKRTTKTGERLRLFALKPWEFAWGYFFLRSELKLRRVWREIPEIQSEKKKQGLRKINPSPCFVPPTPSRF